MIIVEWNLTRPKLRLTKHSEVSMLYHPSTRASNTACEAGGMTKPEQSEPSCLSIYGSHPSGAGGAL